MDKAKLEAAITAYGRAAIEVGSAGADTPADDVLDEARTALWAILLSQQAELEALRKVADDLIEHPTADDNVDLRPIIDRAAELRAKGEGK